MLEQRDFLRRQGRNSETGEIEYGFRHLLVRDVVAEQLPALCVLSKGAC